ncbi:MAG: hypothetical protein H0T86_09255, partial [Gemmatimonadales bacterium]|nr:hypothetical protein [Gemmatimonadales bacterium]
MAHALGLSTLASATLWLGCGGGGGDITGPLLGTLEVTTATTGAEPDPDGYAVSIDGTAPAAIAANATRRTSELAVGAHIVELSGLAANCTAAGGIRLSVKVSANAVAAAEFEVDCAPTTGSIQVTTTSAGGPEDPDGYRLLLDGADTGPIGIGASLTLPPVAAGPHTVGLGGLAATCVMEGENPRAVAVAAGSTATVSITVTCTPPAPPPAPGSITVTTQTSGADQDADGYAVTLDGGDGLPIGTGASLPLADLSPGSHTVGLTGISANCRLDGDNPRTVSVTPGTVASVAFAIGCVALPPSAGTLEITTVTTGSNPDPDGYTFVIDAGTAQAIGVGATVRVASLAAGAHAVILQGAAANCAIGGANPRTVTIIAGGTAQVTFAITCAASTGTLRVTTATTGISADPDGYTVAVDGGTPSPVGASAAITIEGLEPRAHDVRLGGVAANCQVQSDNPRSVTVKAGETVTTDFAVVCAATTGGLAITVTGLPAGTDVAVTVTGPDDFTAQVAATRTLADLAPGDYTVAAAEVTSGGTQYTSSPANRTVAVVAAETASVTVTYGPAAGPSLNLRIDGWYLSQSVQSPEGDVPLVGNRDGYLRVFVVANESNSAAPSVRVRLYRGGSVAQTLTIPAPGASTPTARDDDDLTRSWNVHIPRELIASGFAVVADVDPADAVPENNEDDNSYPVSGTPQPQTVRSVPDFTLRFVPIVQRANGLTGDVTDASRSRFLDLTRRMYPMAVSDADLHLPYTTTFTGALEPDDANSAWLTILSEIDALRVAEGETRTYYGVVRIGYSSGIAGLGYIGVPTAIGYDDVSDRGRVMAHELGHNWGRLHAPCGFPGGVDPDYPHPGGTIGAYGVDMRDEVLKPPSTPDIMGYCGDPWISDYTYEQVLAYRTSQAALVAAASTREQRCLVVWGRIVDGRPVLEPAFELVTRPSLPRAPGPYAVEATAADGSQLFNLSFAGAVVADGRRDARQFAFAVPLDERAAARLERIT